MILALSFSVWQKTFKIPLSIGSSHLLQNNKSQLFKKNKWKVKKQKELISQVPTLDLSDATYGRCSSHRLWRSLGVYYENSQCIWASGRIRWCIRRWMTCWTGLIDLERAVKSLMLGCSRDAKQQIKLDRRGDGAKSQDFWGYSMGGAGMWCRFYVRDCWWSLVAWWTLCWFIYWGNWV